MNFQPIIATALCWLLCHQAMAQDQSMEKGLSELTTKLASQATSRGKKKLTVLDFTDLQGGSSELGRYLAEQLTVNLVIDQTNFSVLDRANLKSILAEHKLTAKGLVDPENAKKLGQFAGVDALILGNIVPMKDTVEVTAKIISTDTAIIAGAARIKFKPDENVQHLLSTPALSKPGSETKTEADVEEQKSKLTKDFGDLRVELKSLNIVNDKDFQLTVFLVNKNPKKSIWVALNAASGNIKTTLTDHEGSEFELDGQSASAIAITARENGGFFQATEIRPSNSIAATLKFFSRSGKAASLGFVSIANGGSVGTGIQWQFFSGYNPKSHLQNRSGLTAHAERRSPRNTLETQAQLHRLTTAMFTQNLNSVRR